MRLFRNPQLWLALAKEIWERNRHQNLSQAAGNLAFTTTLALVPMFTVASMLLGTLPKVVRMKVAFQSWLLDTYMHGGLNQQVFIYLDQFSRQAKGLTLVSTLGLIVTSVMAISGVEQAFNRIFQLSGRRPILNQILIYSGATLIGPFLLGFGIYLSSLLFGAAEGWIDALSTGFAAFATISPMLLAVVVFMIAYKYLPYTPVAWRDAFAGAIIAAFFFELMKFGFGLFLTNARFYRTVYGAFAILPLALIWIYLTWWITLAGAVIVANLPPLRAGLVRVIRY